MICLGLELAIDANILIRLALDDGGRGMPSPVRRMRSEWNAQLITVNELGVAVWIWMGVRDDFRNWLLTAA
jgi:hypothetical protein